MNLQGLKFKTFCIPHILIRAYLAMVFSSNIQINCMWSDGPL